MFIKALAKGLLAVPAFAAAALGVRLIARETNRVVPENGINEGLYIEINGVKQWINIYGKDLNNPVMLYLHGGPGGATSGMNWVVFHRISDIFTVVDWDQRNCGKSFDENKTDIPITPELFVSDTVELVKYILKRFGKEKLTLCGLSWGTMLGSRVVLDYPQYFNAYIPMGLCPDVDENETLLRDRALEMAKEKGDEEVIKAAERFTPETYDPQHDKDRNILIAEIFKEDLQKEADANLLWAMFASPTYSLSDSLKKMQGKLYPRKQLDDFLLKGGAKYFSVKDRTEYEMPFYLMQGDHDSDCLYELAIPYYERVKAPDKNLYIVEGGHTSPFVKTAVFEKNIRDIEKRMRERGMLK